ncbi:hypothetical protein Tco_0422106 [Tanacetum coccineum]
MIHALRNSEDEEEPIKRDEKGAPIYKIEFLDEPDSNDPIDLALARQDALNLFRKICTWKKMVAFLGSLPVQLQHNEWMPKYADKPHKKVEGDGAWHVKCIIVDPIGNEHTMGNSDDEAGSSRSKRSHARQTVEEAMLPRVHHPMGCAEEIEEMLEIKVVEEIFTSEAWRRAFDINDLIFPDLCKERLIAEEPDAGEPRVAMPTPPRHSLEDLYDKMGSMEIQHGAIERMAYRHSRGSITHQVMISSSMSSITSSHPQQQQPGDDDE